MEHLQYTYRGAGPINLLEYSTAAPKHLQKDQVQKLLEKNKDELNQQLDKLYAEKKQGILILLQSLDGAGKFSLIKNLFSCFNAIGLQVHFFDSPCKKERSHDFLWRYHSALPSRGEIALFNHSYYEDVVESIAHRYDVEEDPKQPKPTQEDINQTFADLVNFENYLQHNSYHVVKLFLNVSESKQIERYIDRMQKPSRHWKFSSADLVARVQRPDYISAYAQSFAGTATESSPWYIVPADNKWYTQYVVSSILLEVFHKIAPKYPSLSPKEELQIPIYLDRLTREMQNHETKL